MSYEYVKVGECCHFVSRGKTPIYDELGNGKVVKSAQVQVDSIRWKECPTVSNAFVAKHKDKFALRKGDVLLNGTGTGTLGRPSYIDEEPDGVFILDSHVNLFRTQKSKLFHKYLFYWLLTPYCQRAIELSYTGSTNQIELSATRAGNLVIPLPPLEEQKRIAAILDKADAIRWKRKEAIALTEELLRSLCLDMFGDPVTNPKGWEVVPMKSVVRETQYGTSAKSNTEQNGLPILRMNNITYRGEIDLNDIKWCQIEECDESKYTTKRGDLLFNRTNSPELVGKTGVWRSDEKFAIAGYLVRVRFQENKANSEYVSAYLNSSFGKKYLYEKAKPSNNMSNFSASEFVKIPILLAPIELQNKFKSIADKARDSISNLNTSLTKSETLFNSLLQKAFRGEL